MADKKFNQKGGYQNLLDIDTKNGIVKYGSYEFFLKDLGVTPQSHVLTFDDYKKSVKAAGVGALSLQGKLDEKTMRENFDKKIAGLIANDGYGAIAPITPVKDYKSPFSGPEKTNFLNPGGDAHNTIATVGYNKPSTSFHTVTKLGDGSYSVDQYSIPQGVDFINKIATMSAGIKTGVSSDLLAQNQADAKAKRQGQAATVLGG
jgi:hypothetical protein